MRDWDWRHWLVAAVATVGFGALLGVVTAVVPNPLFTRMVEAPWWVYPAWIASAVLAGLLAATYVGPSKPAATRRSIGGAVLAWFAVGCPVCNKLVVLALGASGALAWFEPIQPLLAIGSVILLAVALRARLRAAVACPVDPSPTDPSPTDPPPAEPPPVEPGGVGGRVGTGERR